MLGRRANVAIIVALAMVPMCGLVGLAIDYGRVSWVRGKLDTAADSAALLAATTAANAAKAGESNAVALGEAAANARFEAITGNQNSVTIGNVNIGLTQTGGLFSATVTYDATVASTFGALFGINSFPISDQVGASLSYNPFADVQILMDVSSSMTLAADASDQATMENLTQNYKGTGPNVTPGEACAFACHWSNTTEDFYALALKNNVSLRITVMKAAVQQVIGTMEQQDQNSRFEIGLYSFADVFTTLYALSNDITDAATAAGNVTPALNNCSGNCDNTYFTNAMTHLASIDASLPKTGTNVPQKFLFVISDGVYDETLSSGGRAIGAFSPGDCASLKSMGVTILVLYTPYIAIPDNAFWVDNVEPITPQIQPNLLACASSPSYFFEADDATAITNQLNAMFQLVLQSSSHLTE